MSKKEVLTPKNNDEPSTLKQFLLSLVATTISIILTFGTAAWVENRKKEEAKHEIVMMVLYDLTNSLEQVQTCDSVLHIMFEKQLKMIENPELLEQEPFAFIHLCPSMEYTNTVEQIFSSNIETINTLGNVLFAEYISRLYKERKDYKELICDSCQQALLEVSYVHEYQDLVDYDIVSFIQLSKVLRHEMESLFQECQQMMGISNEELEAYRQERFSKRHAEEADSVNMEGIEELRINALRLEEAIEKGRFR